jgi:hypothetical protein
MQDYSWHASFLVTRLYHISPADRRPISVIRIIYIEGTKSRRVKCRYVGMCVLEFAIRAINANLLWVLVLGPFSGLSAHLVP